MQVLRTVINSEIVNDYIVFDFETTGISRDSKIIEFTFLKYKNNKLIDKLTSLVNPMETLHPVITNITGITNDMLKNKLDISYYAKDIYEFIKGYPLVGHNIIRFDYDFLKRTLEKYIDNNEILKLELIDTLRLARALELPTENYRLETIKEYLKIDCISHRSEADCVVTNELYQYLKANSKVNIEHNVS